MSEASNNPDPYSPEYPIDTDVPPTRDVMAVIIYLVLVIFLILIGILAQTELAGTSPPNAVIIVGIAAIFWALSFGYSIRRRRGGIILSIFFLLSPSLGSTLVLIPEQMVFQVHFHLLLITVLLATVHINEIRRFDRRISGALRPPW